MAYTTGQKIEFLGAALSGQVPQFQQQMEQLDEKRMEAMYKDAGAAYQLLGNNDYQGIINLANDRLGLLQRLPGSDPSDTMQVLQLAQGAAAGNSQSLSQLTQVLKSANQQGLARGYYAAPAGPERIIVGENQTVMEVGTDGELRQVATGAPKQKSPTTEIGKLDYDLLNENITQAQYDAQITQIERAENRVISEDESRLRKEFNAIPQVKSFSDQSQAYGRIIASAESPSAAGDLALIFNYMKVLDPGSTVREGEFANAQNAGSVPARLGALYNNVVDGQRLTVEQRQDFVDRGGRLYKDAETGFMKRYNQYSDLAILQKLPFKNVVTDYRYTLDPNVLRVTNQSVTDGMQFNNEEEVNQFAITTPIPDGEIVYVGGQPFTWVNE
jgi:hypothetical protein